MTFLDPSSGVQCGLAVSSTPTQKLFFWRGNVANIIGTGTTFIVASSWYMVEVKVTIDPTVGAVTVNLDGASEIAVTGVNSQGTGVNTIQKVMLAGSAGTGAVDDLYMCDTTGPAPYNAFLGVIRVETLFPTSNTGIIAWTPLANTNWQEVGEVNMDQDVSYNAATGPAVDLFNHGVLSSTPVTIFATEVITAYKKSDVTNQGYRSKLVSGATTVNGTLTNPPTVYVYSKDMYLLDPNGAIAWTAANVNATKIGYERTT